MPNNLVKDIKPIIQEAGDILLKYFHKKSIKKIVKSNRSFATQADFESEKLLKEKLSKIFPEASFLAEESGKSGNSDYVWVIDPLDGTTNFYQGIPYFCISVALTYLNNPIFGAIFDPLRDEFFYAIKDKGAFLNGKALAVSSKNKLSECFIGSSFPCGWKKEFKKNLKSFEMIRSEIFGMRLMGAAALDQANVAAGRFDGSFFETLKWWDIAAGVLIIQEAGGLVTDFEGNPITPEFSSYVSGSKLVNQSLRKHL